MRISHAASLVAVLACACADQTTPNDKVAPDPGKGDGTTYGLLTGKFELATDYPGFGAPGEFLELELDGERYHRRKVLACDTELMACDVLEQRGRYFVVPPEDDTPMRLSFSTITGGDLPKSMTFSDFLDVRVEGDVLHFTSLEQGPFGQADFSMNKQ